MNQQNSPNPGIYKKNSSELKELILQTASMSEDEKQYWTQILPIMNEEQLIDLQKILTEEKDSLKKIDDKYAENEAKIKEFQESLARQQRLSDKIKQLRKEESESEEAENIEQEKLLNELS